MGLGGRSLVLARKRAVWSSDATPPFKWIFLDQKYFGFGRSLVLARKRAVWSSDATPPL